jgi:NADPH-dependent ferric siderophore reductase
LTIALSPPAVTRVRHELRRRILTVIEVQRLTPHMVRVHLTGEDLDGFTSLSPDDHIKLFVPTGVAGAEPEMRDYTPRSFDAATRTLTIDFAVHEAGPATAWALSVQPGDWVQVGGPRGSQVIAGPVPHLLLIGDETALPAIGRRIEEATFGAKITCLVAVPGVRDEQRFFTDADLSTLWVHRPVADAADPAPLLNALRALPLPEGTFAWIAAEAQVARALRTHLLEERGHPLGWLKAAGYWVQGKANTTEKFD